MSGASFVGAGEAVGERLMSVAPPPRVATSADLPAPVAACGASGAGANAEGYEGRVYDAFTGHMGATIDEYKALWEYADGIKFGF